jgi:hypothetical protein
MKQMVRRARTTGVGYVKLGFQREMDLSEKQTKEIADRPKRLAVIGRLTPTFRTAKSTRIRRRPRSCAGDRRPSKASPSDRREGLTFDFPHSTKIIPSISTQKLMGWVGCEWLAEEIMLSPDRIKEVYGVDVGKSFTAYRTVGGSPEGGETRRSRSHQGRPGLRLSRL